MLVLIVGPNLPCEAQVNAGYRVHLADCADLQRGWIQVYAKREHPVEVASRVEVAETIYDNGIMEEGETGLDYLHDFHFAPCCDKLPKHAGYVVAADEAGAVSWWVPSGSQLDEALSSMAFLCDGASIVASPQAKAPDFTQVIDGKSGRWNLLSDHAPDHPDVLTAMAHGQATGTSLATFNYARVGRWQHES